MCLPGHSRGGRTWGHLCPACLGGLGEGEGEGGGWSEAFRAVVSWIASESRSARGLATDLPRDTGLRIAQRISFTLHWENARDALPGRFTVARVWLVTRFLRLVGEHLVRSADPLSCCCDSSHRFPVSVCPLCCVCFLPLCRSVACSGSFCLFSALPLVAVVMCLRPSLLVWGFLYCGLYFV